MSERRTEAELVAQLAAAFPELEGKIRIARVRRVWAEVEEASFRAVLEKAVKELGFIILCLITGLDEGESLGFIYHLADLSGTMLNLHTLAPKSAPKIRTVTDLFPTAHIYERELVDLFGAVVEGLPEGNRYPLPDGWPEGQYPLRKDWDATVLDKPAAPASGERPAASGGEGS
jgi:Ni,Fe-hydrogenase III component G